MGGNPEVVRHGENGLLVPLDDGDAIVSAIERLLREPEFAEKLHRQAAKDVLDYRWDKLVEKTATTLEGLQPNLLAPTAG